MAVDSDEDDQDDDGDDDETRLAAPFEGVKSPAIMIFKAAENCDGGRSGGVSLGATADGGASARSKA
ncbi:hypothetical protein BSZ21_05975 [Bradyrhizobium canariense]|nr:hypothetical protein BSZ21_05975 [Bradyrhizobium canariense]